MESLTPEQIEAKHQAEAVERAATELLPGAPPPTQKPTRQRKSKAAGLTEERVREIVKASFDALFVVSANAMEVRLEKVESWLTSNQRRLGDLENRAAGLEGVTRTHSERMGALERSEADVRANAGERFNEVQRLNRDYSRCMDRATDLERRAEKLEVLAEKFSNKIVDAALAKAFGGQ